MRFLTMAHRWMGVVLCLFFACWFISGAILIYHPFPSLSKLDRLARSSNIEPSQINVSPKEAVQVALGNELDRLRLIDLMGHPIYVLHGFENNIRSIDATSGKIIDFIQKDVAKNIAEKFTEKSALKVEGPIDYDQWIVPNRYDPYRPFYRVSLEDNNDTVLYVSARTGEVLQKTEYSERVWNYFGAVIHWIYPTVIRKDWALWDQLVWWVSLFGILGVIAGMILGIKHSVAGWKRGSKGLASPFSGWLAWHHKIGFVFGVFALLWIFSGWLSMDHGRLFSTPAPSDKQEADVRGISLTTALSQASHEDLTKFLDTREFEISALAGQALLIAKNDHASELSLIGMDLIPDQQYLIPAVQSAVSHAWPSITIKDSYMVAADDVYGHLREGSLPESTLRVVLDDVDETWVHVNLDDGRIISVMDRSRRMYRWLFNGIHSLDVPGLADKRPLWDVLMVLFMIAGFMFSITGVVIAYRKLVRLLIK